MPLVLPCVNLDPPLLTSIHHKKKVAVLDHDSTINTGARARLPHLILRPEIAAVQRRRWRHNLHVLFNDIPQTKAEKEACLLKGGTKK